MRKFPKLTNLANCFAKFNDENIDIETLLIRKGYPDTVFINYDFKRGYGYTYSISKNTISKIYPDL